MVLAGDWAVVLAGEWAVVSAGVLGRARGGERERRADHRDAEQTFWRGVGGGLGGLLGGDFGGRNGGRLAVLAAVFGGRGEGSASDTQIVATPSTPAATREFRVWAGGLAGD